MAALAALVDHQLIDLCLADAARGEDEEALADALQRAFERGRVQALLDEKRGELDAVRLELERGADELAQEGPAALSRTVEAVRVLTRASARASELQRRAEAEEERVRPIADKVEPILRELRQLTNEREYVRCGLLLARAASAPAAELSTLLELLDARTRLSTFMAAQRQAPLAIESALSKRIKVTTRQLRRRLEVRLGEALKGVHWPVTSTNPALHLAPAAVARFQEALCELLRAQLACARAQAAGVAAPEPLVDGSGELTGQLWAIGALTRPLEQRFRYHFSGSRSTNRVDKPEWYHAFALSAVRDHSSFLVEVVQPCLEREAPALGAGAVVVDALSLFSRNLVRVLRAQYADTWETVSKSNALVCSTVDEALALDTALREQFGYSEAWPSLAGYFAGEQACLAKWMEADLEFARKKLERALDEPNAWKSLAEALGGDGGGGEEHAAVSGRERINTPECCDHLLGVLSAVCARARAVPFPEGRLAFTRHGTLPLVADYVAALEARFALTGLPDEGLPPPDALRRALLLVNAAEYPRGVLEAWADEPAFAELAQVQRELAGQGQASPDGKSRMHNKLLRGGFKVGGLVARSLGGALQRVAGSAAAAPFAAAADDRLGLWAEPVERLAGFAERRLDQVCGLVARAFRADCAAYAKAARSGAFSAQSREALLLLSPELEPAVRRLRETMEALHARLVPRMADAAARKVARAVSDFMQADVLEAARFDLAGGQRFERDAETLFSAFGVFSQRPGNRFFRRLRESAALLAAPTPALAALVRTLQRLLASWDGSPTAPQAAEMAAILEEGYQAATLAPQDALMLGLSRTDVADRRGA